MALIQKWLKGIIRSLFGSWWENRENVHVCFSLCKIADIFLQVFSDTSSASSLFHRSFVSPHPFEIPRRTDALLISHIALQIFHRKLLTGWPNKKWWYHWMGWYKRNDNHLVRPSLIAQNGHQYAWISWHSGVDFWGRNCVRCARRRGGNCVVSGK